MSKFLSMQWFKSKIERAVEKAIEKKIENLMEEEDGEVPQQNEKPYARIKMVNDVMTAVLHDGNILSKFGVTNDDFDRACKAKTEEELYDIFSDSQILDEKRKEQAELARIKAVQQGIKRLEGLADFEIEGNSVKLAGTGRTMPQLLVEKFIEMM
jgi:hypothetical protein